MVDLSLNSLTLNSSHTPVVAIGAAKQTAKIYRHVGGNTPKAQWIISKKLMARQTSLVGKMQKMGYLRKTREEGSEMSQAWVVFKVL